MKTKFLLFVAFVSLSLSIQAQLLGGIKDKLADKMPSFLKKPSPITTAFNDVKMEGALPESFGNDKTYMPLYKMKAAENGEGFTLCPGYYEMTNMSYCLKAGTHGPSEGDGYMFAPTKGKMDDIVNAILLNHQTKHTEVPQRDVQMLLWAIIARAKFNNLSGKLKVVTALLLTPQQIVKLNGGFVATLGNEALKKNIIDVPGPVQAVMEAENNIRRLVETGVDNYEEFESYALLAGMAKVDRSDIKSGMWTLNPDGYYVRYFPQGYSKTKVQVYVPDEKGKVVYNAIGTIACPANTGAQRLAQTNMPLTKTATAFTDPCASK